MQVNVDIRSRAKVFQNIDFQIKLVTSAMMKFFFQIFQMHKEVSKL